ncbi:MarR family winged helix-turn-helix transcriptional regulator [Kibdelosporangium persicum]|uniref:Transcriptional regulator SlyA n=1 Tax=Kibdelosporangium persicum TaxID=2698649 RepID=A0ABX2F3Q7_9PSEU|nr:Transcriptional regulator SlyA [Kibdelosporangium persicum]
MGLTVARTAKVLGRAFDDVLAETGGSLSTWTILFALKTSATASQRELAEAAAIQGATLTHHLNGLEADGLVTRRRDPANRRVHLVELTEAGEALWQRLVRVAQDFDARLRDGISDSEVHVLEQVLNRLQHNAFQQA